MGADMEEFLGTSVQCGLRRELSPKLSENLACAFPPPVSPSKGANLLLGHMLVSSSAG